MPPRCRQRARAAARSPACSARARRFRGGQVDDDFLPRGRVPRRGPTARIASGCEWAIEPAITSTASRLTSRPTSEQAQLGALALPAGKLKNDEFFGEQEVYYGTLTATLPVSRNGATASSSCP
jgi:thiol:disulfide interchange protein